MDEEVNRLLDQFKQSIVRLRRAQQVAKSTSRALEEDGSALLRAVHDKPEEAQAALTEAMGVWYGSKQEDTEK